MDAPLNRHTYTTDQLKKYYRYISLPDSSIAALKGGQLSLSLLTKLQQYQLAAVPFENLSLHYSTSKTISLHPDDLYEKIVGRGKGRGGYCMENNCFFGTVLRSVGFDVYSAGARVNDGGREEAYTGWCVCLSFPR